MAAEWTWMLCDGSGQALAELTTATGRLVTFRRNSYAEATCTIGVEDDAALLIAEALKTGWPRLRLYRRADGDNTSTLVFNGHFAPLVGQAEVGSSLQIVARSPFARTVGCPLVFLLTYVATDAGAIATDLATGWSDLNNLYAGNTVPTKTRDVTYKVGQDVGAAVVNLSNMLDGFDFTERYTDATNSIGGAMAYLDVYARLGTDRPNAQFQYGEDTIANVRNVTQTIAPPINSVLALGNGELQSGVQHMDSRNTYGSYRITKSFSSITTQSVLDDRARTLLRPNPIVTVDLTPESTAPSPWDDFYLGDTVGLFVDRGALQINTPVRVNAFTVVVDDNGLESAEIADPATPDEEATLTANLEVEVVAA